MKTFLLIVVAIIIGCAVAGPAILRNATGLEAAPREFARACKSSVNTSVSWAKAEAYATGKSLSLTESTILAGAKQLICTCSYNRLAADLNPDELQLAGEMVGLSLLEELLRATRTNEQQDRGLKLFLDRMDAIELNYEADRERVGQMLVRVNDILPGCSPRA